MSEKKATRNAYGDALVALADRYPQLVVLEADLAGATMTKGFKAAYPQRFFDMGIAESNMQGVAAGLSTCGFKPFTNTFAMFASVMPISKKRSGQASLKNLDMVAPARSASKQTSSGYFSASAPSARPYASRVAIFSAIF